MTAPLIVTLQLDEAAQQRFDRLREEHFPPERNVLAAHVTLFHALPGAQLAAVQEDVAEVAARPAFPVRVSGVRSLGRGTAYVLEAEELTALRAALGARWSAWLTPQDRQRFSAHVTVQNKVAPAAAAALREQLLAGFTPYDVQAVGIGVWRYLDGPWEHVRTTGFG